MLLTICLVLLAAKAKASRSSENLLKGVLVLEQWQPVPSAPSYSHWSRMSGACLSFHDGPSCEKSAGYWF